MCALTALLCVLTVLRYFSNIFFVPFSCTVGMSKPKRKLCKPNPRCCYDTARRVAQRTAVPTPPPPPLSLPPRPRLAFPAGTYCNGVKQESHELLTLDNTLVKLFHKMEQMEAVDNTLVKMEAGESDQDDEDTISLAKLHDLLKTPESDQDEDDSDELANCIISSDDDANLLCRHDHVMAATWSEFVSRSMTRFLRYNAFEQGLLTDSGWILLGTLVRHLQLDASWKANLDASMISTHDVLHEVKQNGKPGKLPYFELFMSGQQVWVRATPGKRRHQ